MGKKKKISTRLNMPPSSSTPGLTHGGSGGQQPPELNRSCSVPADKFAKVLNSHNKLPTSPEESSGIDTG